MITRNLGSLDPLEEKLYELERKKIAYLEVEDKAGAGRIEKQIEKIKLEKELSSLTKIKNELKVYKKVVQNYPSVLCEIKRELSRVS